jgi:ferredoxin
LRSGKNLILFEIDPNRSFIIFTTLTARKFNMALYITEECTYCGACEPECPVTAISAGDDVYVIDAATCTECAGYADAPSCAAVCPSDAIVQG